MSEKYRRVIARFSLFEGFTEPGVGFMLESGEVKEHAAGTRLFAEGDPSNSVLLVISGKLQIYVERQERRTVLTEAEPGSLVGELGVLCGLQRSASVSASEDSVVLEWTAEAFRLMLLRDTSLSQRIFRRLLKTLVDKERSLIESSSRSQE